MNAWGMVEDSKDSKMVRFWASRGDVPAARPKENH